MKKDNVPLIREMPFHKSRVLNLLFLNQMVGRRGCRGVINVSKEMLIGEEGKGGVVGLIA